MNSSLSVNKPKRKIGILFIILPILFVFSVFMADVMRAKAAGEDVPINETTFPDENFRAYITEKFDNNPTDGKLSDNEIEFIKAINVDNLSISNLKGIELFSNLEELHCVNNRLTEIDLSENKSLTYLKIDNNQLSSIDLSKNTSLTNLEISYNQLSSIDLSDNISLEVIEISNNMIDNIDIRKNTELKAISCYSNQLTSLDVRNNTELYRIQCGSNQLTSLDVRNNKKLGAIDCSDNQITNLDLSSNSDLRNLVVFSNKITQLDISQNSYLINCYLNGNINMEDSVISYYHFSSDTGFVDQISIDKTVDIITESDIRGTVTISGINKYGQTLTATVSDSNAENFNYQWQRGNTDISGATSSTYKLVKADIGKTITCVVTDANGNYCESIKSKATSAIEKADGPAAPSGLKGVEPSNKGLSDGKITGVKTTMEYSTKKDFSSNVKACDSTTITGLKAGTYYVRIKETATAYASSAKKVVVKESGILVDEKSFPDENFRAYISDQFDYNPKDNKLSDNEIAEVSEIICIQEDISNLKGIEYFTYLESLYCASNNLTELDLTNNTSLVYIDASCNKLTNINITQNKALKYLYLCNNQLTSINLSNNTDLTECDLGNNQLTSIDLSINTSLEYLSISNNNYIESLDVSKNTELLDLYCSSNKIKNLNISSNKKLRELSCGKNQITELDLSVNTDLYYLECCSNKITKLNICQNNSLLDVYINGEIFIEGSSVSYYSAAAQLSVDETTEIITKPEITGTVTVKGTAKFGQTLTASVSKSNATKFKYQWKRGTANISGATSSKYTLVKADIGKTITCVVTDANGNYCESITSKATAKVEKADGPAAPEGLKGVATVMKGNSDGKITGVNTTMEYSTKSDFSSNVKACTATTITKLKAGTYYVRIKETDTTKASEGTPVTVKNGPTYAKLIASTKYSGLAKNAEVGDGIYYYKEGVQDTAFTGFIKGEVLNSFNSSKKPVYLAESNAAWYVEKGVVNTSLTMVKGKIDDVEKTYKLKDGKFDETFEGIVTEAGKKYLFKAGIIQTKWIKDGTKYYYGDPATGEIVVGWKQISGKYYYFNTDGAMVTGWKKIGSKYYYFTANGDMVTGWKQIDSKYYYFTANGDMVTGWQKLDGKYYYFKTSGEMATGWQTISSKKYYFKTSGVMVTGWQKIDSKQYYFKSNGEMATGWVKDGGKYYYMMASGVMKTGWLQLDGKWYYFNTDGSMVTGTKKIGSKTYKFNSSGVCQNP